MTGQGIFSGIRIVELAQFVFVPAATVFFADQGADVIHIEPPGVGDPYRKLFVGDGREIKSVNLAMEQNNRGKKSVALDLKTSEGREAFLALIRTADVFVTSLRPKAIRALRVDVGDLREANPKLIYVRGNGVGFEGADANKPGFDSSAFWARGGLAHVMTLPEATRLTPPRPAMGDHAGSVNLAFGIAGALLRRAMTGEPSVVETSLLATALWMLSGDITYAQSPGYSSHSADSSRYPLMNAYPTRDNRKIQLMLLNPEPYWPSLCKLLELEELVADPRFADQRARTQNGAELIKLIGQKIVAHDWDHWAPIFEGWEAPWEYIRTIEEIHEDPQVIANEMVYKLPLDDGEQIELVSTPVRFDGRSMSGAPQRAPLLGEHTDEVLLSAGYSRAAITELKASRAAQ